MKTSRLTALHVHIIGIVMCLIIFLVVLFAMIRPKNQDTEVLTAAATAAEQAGGTTAAIQQSTNELKNEKVKTAQINADWQVYAVKYMPNLKWDKDPLNAYYFSNQINEIPSQWGKWVTNWYNAQHNAGIDRAPGLGFPIPSIATDPNAISNLTSITFPSAKDPWKVTVICKTFDDAMSHLRRFNGMEHHGMPVVDKVTLSGHSPELELAYNMSLYVIPAEAPPPADPRIGVGSGTGGAGGGPPMGGGSGGSGGNTPRMLSMPGGKGNN